MKINKAYCFMHDKMEWFLPWYYKACGECGHVWKTKKAFVKDIKLSDIDMARHAKLYGYEHQPLTKLEAVFMCPLCAHDF